MATRKIVIVGAVGALACGVAISVTAMASSNGPSPVVQAQHSALEKKNPALSGLFDPQLGLPNASGSPASSPIPPAASCPLPAPSESIATYNGGSPIKDQSYMTSVADVTGSDGNSYIVYAGSKDIGRDIGEVIVFVQSLDPCKSHDFDVTPRPAVILPSTLAGVSISAVSGDTVTLRDINGNLGRFDYVQGRIAG